jgi:hypothetical protein
MKAPEPAGARSWGTSPPISISVPPPPGTRRRGRLSGRGAGSGGVHVSFGGIGTTPEVP